MEYRIFLRKRSYDICFSAMEKVSVSFDALQDAFLASQSSYIIAVRLHITYNMEVFTYNVLHSI